MTDQSSQQQLHNTDYSLKNADTKYHIHHQDVGQDKLKEIVKTEGFHEGHEKHIPEAKDMMDPMKFKQTAQTVEQHLVDQQDKLPQQQAEQHKEKLPQQAEQHEEGFLEAAKEFFIDAKDAIVEGASNLVEGAKHLFKSDNNSNQPSDKK
jgi:hypothetical protein